MVVKTKETIEAPSNIDTEALATFIHAHVHSIDQYTSQQVAEAVVSKFNVVAKQCG